MKHTLRLLTLTVETSILAFLITGCQSKPATTTQQTAPSESTSSTDTTADPLVLVEKLCAAAAKGDSAYVKANADLPMRFSTKTAPEKCGRATGKRCSTTGGMIRDAEGLAVACKGLEGIDPAKSDAPRKAKLAASMQKRINDYRVPVTNGEENSVIVVSRVEGRLRLVGFDGPKEDDAPVGGGEYATGQAH